MAPPSGSTDTSPEDITLTEQLLQAAQTLGLPLMDQLILGGGSFTRLRQYTDMWEQFGPTGALEQKPAVLKKIDFEGC